MYSNRQLKFAKILTIVAWLFTAGSFFFPLYDWASGPPARSLFWILLVAHTLELAFFTRFYRQTEGSLLRHVLGNLVFGVIYYTEVKQRHERA